MKVTELSIPEIGLIAATRGMLGAGIGLLMASHLDEQRRRKVGGTLLALGAVSTLPLIARVMSKRHRVAE